MPLRGLVSVAWKLEYLGLTDLIDLLFEAEVGFVVPGVAIGERSSDRDYAPVLGFWVMFAHLPQSNSLTGKAFSL